MSNRRFFGLLGIAALAVLVVGLDAAMGQGRGRGGFGRGGFGNDMGSLLRRDDVKKELDLTDDQVQEIQDAGEELRDRMREEMRDMWADMRNMRDMSNDERQEMFAKIREKVTEMTNEAYDGILVRHQKERLEQIMFQRQTGGGLDRALRNDSIIKKLNITDEQKKKLEKKAEELREERAAKIKKMDEDLQKELLSVLSPDQRKKYEELSGDKFETDNSQFRRGRGGQDRGGQDRGGRRGGGGGDGA